MADLPVEVFVRLRRRFFDGAGRPVPFPLRPKRNTQDDPFDEFLATEVLDDPADPFPTPLRDERTRRRGRFRLPFRL